MIRGLMVLLVAAAPLTASAAGTLQCWTDEKGHRACGDRVPPQYAKQERDILNKQGIVVDKKDRQKTAAEIAADQQRKQAEADEKDRRQKQSAYDQYMLQTFESVTQMQGVRDTRVQALDGRIKLAEKSVADTEKSLQDLKARVAEGEKAGKPDLRAQKQVGEFEAALVDTLKSVAQLKKERAEVLSDFDRDARRYKKLRSGELSIGAPEEAPPPATAAPVSP